MSNLKSGNVVVRFLLGHGEKIGMAIVVICAGMLVWTAISREQLEEDRGPDSLRQTVSRAKAHMDETKWEAIPVEDRLTADSSISNQAMKPILVSHFPPFKHPLNRQVISPVGLRTDPTLLPAVDLEVYGDSGLWVSADPATVEKNRLAAAAENRAADNKKPAARGRLFAAGGGANPAAATSRPRTGAIAKNVNTGVEAKGDEDIKATSWVTLVARVPIEKQFASYDSTLPQALGYQRNRDIPIYMGYRVERAEITSDGQSPFKQLAFITYVTIGKELEKPIKAQEVVPRKYLHNALSYPLPPLLLRNWGRRASHSAIPLSDEWSNTAVDVEDGNEAPGAAPAEDNLFGSSNEESSSDPGSARLPTGVGSDTASKPVGRTMPGGAGDATWDGLTPYMLLRFFDKKAVPGRQYRYRVQLVLKDVNSGVPERYLDKSVLERRAAKKTKYPITFAPPSEPSPIVSAPMPARTYLVAAEAGKGYKEPRIELLVKSLNSEHAAEVATSESFSRGSVVNIQEKATVVRAKKYEPKEEPEFLFFTGLTIVDFSGGTRLSSKNRNLIAPSRAVMMDPAGNLFLQSELEDSAMVAEYQQILEGGP